MFVLPGGPHHHCSIRMMRSWKPGGEGSRRGCCANYCPRFKILKSLEDQLTFARDNYNATSKQFEFGLANSIDVVDANTLLVTSERQLADLRLKRATGTLLKPAASSQWI